MTVSLSIKSGNLQMLTSLIQKGAEISDEYFLNAAAEEGHLDIVKYLVDEKGFKVGHSFWYAAANGHFAVMDYLFEKGVEFGESGEAVNNTFLCNDHSSSRLEVVKYLIEKGAKVDDNSVSCAIQDNSVLSFESVKYLIEQQGAKISDDALYVAVEKGNLDIIKYLIEKGAKITEGILPIAAEEGHLDIVKYLVDETGADVNGYDCNGNSIFILAARSGHFNIAKYLIEKGAEIDD